MTRPLCHSRTLGAGSVRRMSANNLSSPQEETNSKQRRADVMSSPRDAGFDQQRVAWPTFTATEITAVEDESTICSPRGVCCRPQEQRSISDCGRARPAVAADRAIAASSRRWDCRARDDQSAYIVDDPDQLVDQKTQSTHASTRPGRRRTTWPGLERVRISSAFGDGVLQFSRTRARLRRSRHLIAADRDHSTSSKAAAIYDRALPRMSRSVLLSFQDQASRPSPSG